MKFAKNLVVAVMVVLFSAGFVFADDVTVGIHNTNTNTSNATGGNATQDQNQDQRQKQLQLQKQQQEVNGVSGNQMVNTPLEAPIIGAIVGPGGAKTGMEVMLSCNPDYQVFTIDELESMSKSGRFLDERGSIFDALTGVKVKSIIRSKKEKARDGKEIHILNQVPSAKVLGTFSCTGDYGWALDEVLSKCLLEAREKTNTSNVIVYKTNDIDAANSGTAIGAGAGTSVPFRDDNVGAGAVAATFGKTHSMKERVILLEVRAYDDVIEASDVCEQKEEVEVEVSAPATEQQVKTCDPSEFLRKLKKAEDEIFICWLYSNNNLFWQLEALKESMNVWLCTGDVTYLEDAIQHGQMAELNYINGKDIASHANSSKLIGEVEYWLASAFYARDNSLNNFWKAPAYVVHVDKKRGNNKPVALTPYEKKRVEKIRCTLERYSKKLAL